MDEEAVAYAIAGTKAMFRLIAENSDGTYTPPPDDVIAERVRKSMTEKLAHLKESAEGWVTTDSGTHIYLDKDGTITAGPSDMVGQKPEELKKGSEATSAKPASHVRAEKPEAKAPATTHRISGTPTTEHRGAAEKWAAASPGLTPEKSSEYVEHLSHALSKLPPGIAKQAGDSLKHGGVKFHNDLQALRGEAVKINGKSAAGVVGFVRDRGMATDVHLDGGDDPRGTYVHELWHAADNGGFHSEDKGWQAAYKKDILKGKHLLSRYAMTNASEGFAEFGRAIAELGEEQAAAKWPNCVKHLKAKKLL